LAALPHTLIRLNNAAANSLRQFSLSMVPDFVFRPASFCLAVLGLAVFAEPLSEILVLGLFVLSNLLISLVQTKLLGAQSAVAGFTGRLRPGLRRMLRARAMPLALITLISITYTDVVTAVAAIYLPADQVAAVGLSARLAALAGFIAQAQQTIVLRDLTNAIVSGSPDGMRQVLWKTNVIATGLMLAAIAGAAVLGEWALHIFGEAYASSKWLLVLMIVAQLLRAAGGMNLHVLSLKGKQRWMAVLAILSLAVLVVAAAVLTPRLGAPGFVLAVVMADAFWIVSLGILARRLLGYGADIFAVRAS
jgi:O-antigen/teichoic acid export membrane protein